mgnify:CR=1 FL=1
MINELDKDNDLAIIKLVRSIVKEKEGLKSKRARM